MKIHKNPKRYQFQFDDHSMDSGLDVSQEELKAMTAVPRIDITTTGWLLGEDEYAYMVGGSMFSDRKKKTAYFSDVWTILKVKGLVKARCDD